MLFYLFQKSRGHYLKWFINNFCLCISAFIWNKNSLLIYLDLFNSYSLAEINIYNNSLFLLKSYYYCYFNTTIYYKKKQNPTEETSTTY